MNLNSIETTAMGPFWAEIYQTAPDAFHYRISRAQVFKAGGLGYSSAREARLAMTADLAILLDSPAALSAREAA